VKDDDVKHIEVSEKHVGLRLVLFVLFLIIAIGAFSYGITSIGKKESGYQTIDALQDSQAPLYANELSLSYYFEGSSSFIKKEARTISKIYSQILASAYKQLDASSEYSGDVSIGAINNNLGTTVSVSPLLYAVLKDAYSRTLECKNYNMFAGALYSEWKSILILDEPDEFDPLNNTYMAERITAIAQEVANLDNFTLEFLDDTQCLVRFSVSDHYASFCKEMEITAGALDLNVLQSSYMMQWVAQELRELGYNNGILISREGSSIELSGESCTAFMSAYQYGGYYNAVVNGKFRHLFINTATGLIEDVILSCTINSVDCNLVDDMASLVYLASLSSKDEVLSVISSFGDYNVEYVFQDDVRVEAI